MRLKRIHLNCRACGDCLLWQGKTSQAGHPQLYDGSGRRKVWELTYGPIPEGMLVSVDCGQLLCLTPEHLKLTTRSEVSTQSNARPAVKAKRAASSARTNRRKLGKITMAIARQIRTDSRTAIVWAAELNCSAGLVSHVRCQRSWVEMQNPFAGLMAR